MTDRDIDGNLLALGEAMQADNHVVALQAAFALLSGALKDLNRIADALEEIARVIRRID